MKLSHICFFLFITLICLPGVLTLAQQPSSSTAAQVAGVDKSGKEAVCDGALEIIPGGQATFARKRYVPSRVKATSKPARQRPKSSR